uniref:Uncharacterized protein n=1 Tax=Rhizophora mucronata TaxID=61149 RepID=A0A2P2Q533_RHIMU
MDIAHDRGLHMFYCYILICHYLISFVLIVSQL